MINEIFFMNGYGFYVWSSFIFTLIGFGTLFYITKSQLVNEQKKYAIKFSTLDLEKIKIAKKNNINREILIGTLNSKI
tara:strand:+ start:380 stop:613 length:234 start_codon:yes stop_codon:yes gene_type:complete